MLKRSVSWIGSVHFFKEDTKLVLNFSNNTTGGDKMTLLWLDITLMDLNRDVEIFRTGGLIDPESSKSYKLVEDSLEFLDSHYEIGFRTLSLAYHIFRVAMNHSWDKELEIEDLNNPLFLQEVECVTFQPHEEEVAEETAEVADEIIEELGEDSRPLLNKIEPRLREALFLLTNEEREYFICNFLSESSLKKIHWFTDSDEDSQKDSLCVVRSYDGNVDSVNTVGEAGKKKEYYISEARWISKCISEWYTREKSKRMLQN